MGIKYYAMTPPPGEPHGGLSLRNSLVDLEENVIDAERLVEARDCRYHLLRDILDMSKTWGQQDTDLLQLSLDYLEMRFPEFACCVRPFTFPVSRPSLTLLRAAGGEERVPRCP